MVRNDPEREFLRSLGDRVRCARSAVGWSQERLGLECGLHRTYVGAVERGQRNITVVNLGRIASALGTPICRLLPDTLGATEGELAIG